MQKQMERNLIELQHFTRTSNNSRCRQADNPIYEVLLVFVCLWLFYMLSARLNQEVSEI